MRFKNFCLYILFTTFLLTLSHPLFNIEIPTKDITVIRIGVVDMDKVLNEYPLTQKLQQDIDNFKQNKMAEIVSIEKEIEELMKQKLVINTEIEQLKTQLAQISVSATASTIFSSESISSTEFIQSSTTVVAQSEQQVEQIKKNIEDKQKNLQQIEQEINTKKQIVKQKQTEIESEIEKMKQKTEAEIYAELYKIIKQIAQQEGLNVVIDKSGILYGEPEIDITDKVLKKIK
jgi:Skp family chaperone for outer membrane proteins